MMSQITEHLFLGSRKDATSEKFLTDNKIIAIVNCAYDWTTPYEEKENIEYLKLAMEDDIEYDISKDLEKACEFLNTYLSKGNVLVHCYAGMSRSAAIVIGYLIRCKEKKYEDAYNLVKEKRPIIRPNDGFLYQLGAPIEKPIEQLAKHYT